jgi:TIR domain
MESGTARAAGGHLKRKGPDDERPRGRGTLALVRGRSDSILLEPSRRARRVGCRRCGPRMSGIFVSYRRDDSSGWSVHLYELLVREWGPDNVFMDIDAIAPGEDFREAIARTMRTCDVVLIVIGPNWVNARDEAGNRRLDDETDTHLRDVASALAADVRVVPVRVGGAAMPKPSDLPEPLKDLAYRNAAIIEDRRFASDVSILQNALKQFAETLVAEQATDEAKRAADEETTRQAEQGETPKGPPTKRPRAKPSKTTPKGQTKKPRATPSKSAGHLGKARATLVNRTSRRLSFDLTTPSGASHRLEASTGLTKDVNLLEGAAPILSKTVGTNWEIAKWLLDEGRLRRHSVVLIYKALFRISAASVYMDGELVHKLGEDPPPAVLSEADVGANLFFYPRTNTPGSSTPAGE